MLRILLSALILFGSFTLKAASPVILQMETDRSLAAVHPRQDSLGVRILIHDAAGLPVSGARLKVHLKAPETPWLGSTDFPVVEGSSLLQQELRVNGTVHSFQFVPPIRGTYVLSASVEALPPDRSFEPVQSTWDITISESPARKKNLGVLLMILIVVGGVSGFVLGRSPRTAALLATLFLLWPPASVKAHGSHESPKPRAPAVEIRSAGHGLELDVPGPEARVGELTKLTARFHDAKGQTQAARFHLEIMQLEHEQKIFATEVIAPEGLLHWQGQFFDGSPHRVSITATALQGPGATVKIERDVEVTGVEPPLRSVIKSFAFLMCVTALALLSGILLGRFLTPAKGGLT